MKSIFELIFNDEISENNRVDKTCQSSNERESTAYDKLMASLSEEQKELFEKYEDAHLENSWLRLKSLYCRAVKIGLRMGFEVGQYDPFND